MNIHNLTFTVKDHEGEGELHVEYVMARGRIQLTAARAMFGNSVAVGILQVQEVFSNDLLDHAVREIATSKELV